MAKFRCRHCNYTFERQSEYPPVVCPNCGEDGFVDRERSAKELLDEFENE